MLGLEKLVLKGELEILRAEEMCPNEFGLFERFFNTLLGGRLCPFIDPRAWFTMHDSRACLHHIFRQSFF
jgi:hypothetical protein